MYNKRVIKYWVMTVAIITLLTGLVYGSVQHTIRMDANDPQIQMAEDAAAALSAGKAPDVVLPTDTIDIRQSLAPFMIIFNNTGKPLASSGMINGITPDFPQGVFDFVRQHGQDRVTWETREGLRFATIVTQYSGDKGGYIVAARSLREVEKREDYIFMMSVGVWVFSMIASFVILFPVSKRK